MARKIDNADYCEQCKYFNHEIWNGRGHCEKHNRIVHKWNLCPDKYGIS